MPEPKITPLTHAELLLAYEHHDEDDNHMGKCILVGDVEKILASRLHAQRNALLHSKGETP